MVGKLLISSLKSKFITLLDAIAFIIQHFRRKIVDRVRFTVVLAIKCDKHLKLF